MTNKEPWQMTKAEFIANPPEGFVYDATIKGELLAHRGMGKTTVGDAFFKLDPQSRQGLLRHEEGHDLMRNFNRDWKDVLEPIRKNPETPLGAHSRWDNPFGFSDIAEEIVADAYASLWEGSTAWYEDPNYPANKILQRTIEIAKREGKPLPPGLAKEVTPSLFTAETGHSTTETVALLVIGTGLVLFFLLIRGEYSS